MLREIFAKIAGINQNNLLSEWGLVLFLGKNYAIMNCYSYLCGRNERFNFK